MVRHIHYKKLTEFRLCFLVNWIRHRNGQEGSSILASMVLDAMGHGRGRDVLPLVVYSGWKNEEAQIQARHSRLDEEPRQH